MIKFIGKTESSVIINRVFTQKAEPDFFPIIAIQFLKRVLGRLMLPPCRGRQRHKFKQIAALITLERTSYLSREE